MKKLTVFIVFMALALLLTLSATPVYAVPALPHAFYGSMTINGSPAPAGTSVEARGPGVLTGITDNPTITTVSGIYGTSNPFASRLIVQGDIEEGATITFYVNGVSTGQTAEWHSGETTELDLTVTIAAPPPPGVGVAALTIEINLLGTVASFRISATGEVLEEITLTSTDGNVTITIPKGTIALDKDGKRLSSLTVDVDPSPPDPPEGYTIIGLVYDFDPDGATFDPPITLKWSYDPAGIPEGVVEKDLVLAYYDRDAGQWVECECTCAPETHTITASIYHLTSFAVIGALAPVPPPPTLPAPAPAVFSLSNLTVRPAEVELGELVTIAVTVANTGGTEGSYTVVLKLNGVKEAEKGVIVAAGGSEIVTFSASREVAGSYSVTVDGLSASFNVVTPVPPQPPPDEEEEVPEVLAKPSPVNWALIVGVIIASVVVVALLIYFLWYRRRAY